MNTTYILVWCSDVDQWEAYANMMYSHYAEAMTVKLEIREKSMIAHNTFTEEFAVYLRITPLDYIYDHKYLDVVFGKCEEVWLCDKHLFIHP